jgi:hypothetical protein
MARLQLPIVPLAAALLMFVSTLAVPSRADDPAAAEALFQEGKRLMDEGLLDQACAKFEGSMVAEPTVGAALNVARCHELAGRTATAWVEYKKAAGMAKSAGQEERRRGALTLADELEQRLPRLTVVVEAPSPAITVLRDGEPLASASYGTAIPIDPGAHEIEARAPGKRPWRATIDIGEAEQKTVAIPALDPVAGPRDHHPDQSAGWMDLAPLQLAGIVVGGVGIATLGVGVGLGVKAMNDESQLAEECPSRICPGADADADAIRPIADGATAAVVIGSAAIAGGLVMIILGGDDATESDGGLSVEPAFGPTSAALSLTGRF